MAHLLHIPFAIDAINLHISKNEIFSRLQNQTISMSSSHLPFLDLKMVIFADYKV